MKGLPWSLYSLAFFSLIIVNIISVEVEGRTAEQLLDEKEKELTGFVAAVEANSRNCGTCLIFLLF